MIMPRLLMVVPFAAVGMGGMERTAVEAGNYLTKLGWNVGINYLGNDGEVPTYLTDPKISLWPIPRPMDEHRDFARVLEAFQPDISLLFYADHSIARYVRVLHERGFAFALHEGSNPSRICDENWAQKQKIPFLQAVDERAALNFLAARTRVTLPDYEDSFPPIVRQTVESFGNFIGDAQREPATCEGNDNRFLFIGGLKANKNAPPLMRAFANMADDFPEWKLDVYSASPPYGMRREVEEFLAIHDLGARVRLFEPVANIHKVLQGDCIHIIPSRSEGHPNCVAEAMWNGLPTIGFRETDGVAHLVNDGVDGILVSLAKDEVGALEAAMRQLAGDTKLRRELGRNARAASERFKVDNILPRWEAFLLAAHNTALSGVRAARDAIDPIEAERLAKVAEEFLERRRAPVKAGVSK